MNLLARNIIIAGFGILFCQTSDGQSILGTWSGELNVPGAKLPIAINVSENDEGFTSTLDSPSQGAMGIPTTSTSFENDSLEITIQAIGGKFKAVLSGDTLNGIFSQAGMNIEIKMAKGTISKPKRPQEPKKPYPYISEEVSFGNPNASGVTLSGTLTLPKGVDNPAVAILITGSGPQNRDETLLGHKPFLVLSDHLTRKGIAVLRYDDRGFGESTGNFSSATSYDFASDVEAAVTYLKGRMDVVDVNKIGLIGHSEGGLIAPIVAAKNKTVKFNVLLAGPGVNGKEILISQTARAMELQGEASKEDIAFNKTISSKVFDTIINSKVDGLASKIENILLSYREEASVLMQAALTDDQISAQVNQMTSPWMVNFIKFDPVPYLIKVESPVLAINGEKDFQVIPDINLKGIKEALEAGNNKDFTVMELEGLNHLFQTCDTGASEEYSTIEETFSDTALNIVSSWINERF